MAEGLAEGGTARAATTGGEDLPPDRIPDPFEQVSAVADAILYEGYLLYPYRRSSAKNRVRWQFGVLFPRDWAEADGPVVPGVSGSADSWYQQTECLLRVRQPGSASVRVRIRHPSSSVFPLPGLDSRLTTLTPRRARSSRRPAARPSFFARTA